MCAWICLCTSVQQYKEARAVFSLHLKGQLWVTRHGCWQPNAGPQSDLRKHFFSSQLCLLFISERAFFFFLFFLKDLIRKVTTASCQGQINYSKLFCWCTQAASPKGKVQEVSRGHKKRIFLYFGGREFPKENICYAKLGRL